MRQACYLLIFYLSLQSVYAIASTDSVERFALVIGNQNYKSAPLKHSLNDAQAITNQLNELGFLVTTLLDVDKPSLALGIADFYAQMQNTEDSSPLAVVYFAGHAIQINNTNYLIPLDIKFDNQQSFMSSLFNLSELFKVMRSKRGTQNIVILDACRNNPFGDDFIALNSKGLAKVKAPFDTLIAYATEPGSVASDGGRKNGVYTKHLLRNITKNISVEEVFKKVRVGVAKETRNKQIPWEHSSLLNEIFFNPPKNEEVPDIIVF